jgi:hypothetical protein
MRHTCKPVLVALAATLALAVAVSGTASARVFSISNRNFRVTWGEVEFSNPSGFGTVRCPMTLEGSFHSQTISKVEKALIGYVNRATFRETACTGGPETVNQASLPWHLTYNGFRGILPRINSIRLLVNQLEIRIREPFGWICNARAEANHEARGEIILNTNGEATNLVPDPGPQIPVTGCFATETGLEGSSTDGRITLQGNTTRIRVTLI